MHQQPSALPEVIFLYGLAGAGKSFVGDLVSHVFGWDLYHADQDLTPKMRQAIAEKRLFTPEMRDEYFQIIAKKIRAIKRGAVPLVVTQAAYKRQHRDYLRQTLPSVEFVCISAPLELIVERLRQRGDFVCPDYAHSMLVNFEPPLAGEKVLVNQSDQAAILDQFRYWYGLP
ncbi:MAG: adenylyl-sulfate kinase [Oligoflexia bacterium]|nr:adenylyl-sulfate kinase [Oligoflexia bacterium]